MTPVCDAAQMALKLEGDTESFFEAPDHPSLDGALGSVFTVEAWVNPVQNTGDPNGLEGFMIVNKEDSYEIAIVEETFRAAVKPDDPETWTFHDSEAPVPVNTWTHVAMTWDGTMVRTFANGKFLLAFEWAGPDGAKGVLNDTDATLKVGRRDRGGETHAIFSGLIDEVRISKVLRYTEAGYAVPGKAFAPDADTVALYHFDEAVDGVVKDASPLGNHGKSLNKAVLVPVAAGPITDTP